MSNLVKQWEGLNKRHNAINKWYGQVYGGPDVNEKNFAEQTEPIADASRILAVTLVDIMAQKKFLEGRMTEFEFEQIL